MRAPIRHALVLVAAIAGGWLGVHGGSALAYGIAHLVDHDIAMLKDMLIWSSLSGAPVGAMAGVWLALTFARASAEARRLALVGLAVAVFAGSALILASYPWPKSSGTPVIEFVLRLPAGMSAPDRGAIDVTVWSGKSGHGCYIRDIRTSSDRPEISGEMVLQAGNEDPTMSLRLNRKAEGYWRVPIKPGAALDKVFDPWQRIEFIATPRADVPPLPAGEYHIRYRVRSYL
jgi:hypothetical protein